MKHGLILSVAALCVFVLVAAIMLKLMPAPLKDSDYIVIGSVATLVTLAVVFGVLIATTRSPDVFFKKRKK